MVRIDEPPKDETELDALRREVSSLTAIVRDIHAILVNSNVGRQAMNELNQRAYPHQGEPPPNQSWQPAGPQYPLYGGGQ